jgi:hypothetical protein
MHVADHEPITLSKSHPAKSLVLAAVTREIHDSQILRFTTTRFRSERHRCPFVFSPERSR